MEIRRKELAKSIFQVQTNDKLYAEKEKKILSVYDFYQNLYFSQNVQDQKINDYFIDSVNHLFSLYIVYL